MDTFNDYVINYPYVKVQKPTADIEEKDVCLIQLCKLQTETNLCKQADLSTNILDEERRLYVYDKKALIVKFCNEIIFVKSTRNNVMLSQSKTFQNDPSKNFHSIVKLLNGI